MRGHEGPRRTHCLEMTLFQIILYFKLYYFPFWWVCTIVMLHLTFWQLVGYFWTVEIALLVVMSLVVVIRMYLGDMTCRRRCQRWLVWLLVSVVLYLHLSEKPTEKGLKTVSGLAAGVASGGFLTLREILCQLLSCFHLRQFDQQEEEVPSTSSPYDPQPDTQP
ncbi:transmembrane protein 17-like [Callorhinchus milii]|uniref:transmembrane protein 17-like n=1 Tax=Callorhinchus milii TaxID=7868 RepID=UPI001C3FA2A7|nr:transmembrane protein 17-like [Callorhinchus milii]